MSNHWHERRVEQLAQLKGLALRRERDGLYSLRDVGGRYVPVARGLSIDQAEAFIARRPLKRSKP